MPNPSALVTGFGPGVGAVLQDVPDLVAVVAHRLVALLGAVPGDMSSTLTPVTSVPLSPLLTPAVLGKVTPALALVALETPAPAIVPLPGVLHLPPVLDHEVPRAPGLPPHVPVLLVHVPRVPLGAVPGKVPRAVTPDTRRARDHSLSTNENRSGSIDQSEARITSSLTPVAHGTRAPDLWTLPGKVTRLLTSVTHRAAA